MLRLLTIFALTAVCFGTQPASLLAVDAPDRQRVADALHRAVDFFRQQVAAEGAYLWRYSEDLKQREGEGRATATMGWVQPPGTPTVGQSFLDAYRLTGDRFYLEAAVETARALVATQLESGGWDYRMEFAPELRSRYAYRVDQPDSDGKTDGKADDNTDGKRRRNVTTLDDDTTQSAVRFLMHVDAALEFEDAAIHKCVTYALTQLVNAQYPNGAWPQRFSAPPDSEDYPVIKAQYPESWSRTFPKLDYRDYYTLNDSTLADMIDVMLEASVIYEDPKYRQVAKKGGDFLILAQLPEPQPAWAQQYNAQMHPAWARKFEPPSITGGESQGALRILMQLYDETGDRKFLEPIPSALAYLKRSELPNGRLARFYELQTNRPLYFTMMYELTYDDDDLPTHYGFIVTSRVDSIERRYRQLLEQGARRTKSRAIRQQPRKPRLTDALTEQVHTVLEAMDKRGVWSEVGRLRTIAGDPGANRVINTQTFARNVGVLATYLAATR